MDRDQKISQLKVGQITTIGFLFDVLGIHDFDTYLRDNESALYKEKKVGDTGSLTDGYDTFVHFKIKSKDKGLFPYRTGKFHWKIKITSIIYGC
jgi:hypothetical protein